MKRAPAKSFEDLIVWQEAHRMVVEIYKYSKNFPREEKYTLTKQLRKAIISVSANIAEGFRRRGIKDKYRFLNIAHASLEEAKNYLILTEDLGYGDSKLIVRELNNTSKQ